MWMTHHLGRNGWRPCRLRYTNTPEPRIPTVEIKSYLSSVVVAKQRCLTGATGLKIVKAGKIAILLNIQSKRQWFYAGVCPFWQIWNTTLSLQDHPNPLNSERQQSKENIIEVVGAKPRKLTGGGQGIQTIKSGKIITSLKIQSARPGFYVDVSPFSQEWIRLCQTSPRYIEIPQLWNPTVQNILETDSLNPKSTKSRICSSCHVQPQGIMDRAPRPIKLPLRRPTKRRPCAQMLNGNIPWNMEPQNRDFT